MHGRSLNKALLDFTAVVSLLAGTNWGEFAESPSGQKMRLALMHSRLICSGMQAQFLDKKHLLISMGPQDAWLQRDAGSAVGQSYCLFLWSLQAVSSIAVLLTVSSKQIVIRKQS